MNSQDIIEKIKQSKIKYTEQNLIDLKKELDIMGGNFDDNVNIQVINKDDKFYNKIEDYISAFRNINNWLDIIEKDKPIYDKRVNKYFNYIEEKQYKDEYMYELADFLHSYNNHKDLLNNFDKAFRYQKCFYYITRKEFPDNFKGFNGDNWKLGYDFFVNNFYNLEE